MVRSTLLSLARSLPVGSLTLALALAAFPGARAVAQSPTHTLPSGFLNNEGDARHWVPTHFAPSFSQATYGSNVIDLPTGNINHLWLRPDSSPDVMAAHTWTVTIHLSSNGVPEPSQVFLHSYEANRGTDRTAVLSSQPVNFPAFTASGNGPQPWNVSVPIQPFPYTAGQPIQIEWEVATPPNGAEMPTWFADAKVYTIRANSGYFIRDHPSHACPDRDTIYAGVVGGPGETMSVWYYSLSGPGLPAVMYFGTSDQSWNGIPLPIDLTPIGFPGCAVRVDLLAGIAGVTDGVSGRFRVDRRIPRDPSLRGQIIYSQNFVWDPSFGGGLRASDRGKITFGNLLPPLEVRHLYTYGAPLGDAPEYASAQAPIYGVSQ